MYQEITETHKELAKAFGFFVKRVRGNNGGTPRYAVQNRHTGLYCGIDGSHTHTSPAGTVLNEESAWVWMPHMDKLVAAAIEILAKRYGIAIHYNSAGTCDVVSHGMTERGGDVAEAVAKLFTRLSSGIVLHHGEIPRNSW